MQGQGAACVRLRVFSSYMARMSRIAVALVVSVLLGLSLGLAPARAESSPGTAQNAICLMLESAARDNNLPVAFFARLIWQESSFNAEAVGPRTRGGAQAQGIAQF